MRRIALVVGAVALLTATGAAGYELAPRAPAACWVYTQYGTHLVKTRQNGNWRVVACVFDRIDPNTGQPVEQTQAIGLDYPPPSLPTFVRPLSTATPRLIFHDRRAS